MASATATARPTGPAWDWPYRITLPETQLIVDAHTVRVLENAAPEFVHAWQQRRLQELLTFAREHSAFWRARLPDALPNFSRLSDLPILDRKEFRQRCEAEGALPVPPQHGAPVPAATSGSAGVPVQFFVTPLSRRIAQAHFHADHARFRRDLQRPHVTIERRVPEHPGESAIRTFGNPWLGEADGWARNSQQSPFAESARWLAEMAPTYLTTAGIVLEAMLDAFEDGIAPPRGIQQVLTYTLGVDARLRARTRSILGARICDHYSCEEAGAIALQCPHDETRHHVCVSSVLLEVVRDDGSPCAAGEPGRVLVTGLHNWASPAIRYDLCDVAELHPQCSCGARVPSLSGLLGRMRSLFRAPSGALRTVRPAHSDWLDAAPVREHRIIQRDARTFRVELVLASRLTAKQKKALTAMLGRVIDPSFTYELVQLDRIDWPATGKRHDVTTLG